MLAFLKKFQTLLNILPIVIIMGISLPTWSAAAASTITIEDNTEYSSAWPLDLQAWPNGGENHRGYADTTAVTVLRTVVLYRADGQESISANLVYVDQEKPEEMIQYNGRLYRLFPLAGNTSLDSQVEIDSQLFWFRRRLRPYER